MISRPRLLQRTPRLFRTHELRVVRQAFEFRKGESVRLPAETFETDASIQPATNRDLDLLPEGNREKDVRVAFSVFRFQLQDSAFFDGKEFVVLSIGPWGPYHRAVMVGRDV